MTEDTKLILEIIVPIIILLIMMCVMCWNKAITILQKARSSANHIRTV